MLTQPDSLVPEKQNRLAKLIDWLGGHEFAVILSLLAITLGVWFFGMVAAWVVGGSAQTFDEQILQLLRTSDDLARPVGPRWLGHVARDITALGGYVVLILVTVAVATFLRLDRKFHAMWFVLTAVSSGYAMTMILKAAFNRPRPSIVPHLTIVSSTSFPSGHSMMSAVVYLTLGVFLTTLVTRRRLKFFFLAVPLLLVFLIGASRVYLGVHYPTDVFAGWSLGLAWASACWLIARRLQKQGTIERHV